MLGHNKHLIASQPNSWNSLIITMTIFKQLKSKVECDSAKNLKILEIETMLKIFNVSSVLTSFLLIVEMPVINNKSI